MVWMVAAVVVGVVAVAWLVFRDTDETIPRASRIDPERLEQFLRDSDIELRSTRNPDPEILRPHISEQDTLVGAVEGRADNKRAYLVLLDDRLVVGEATIGRMGAVVHSIPFHRITDFDQSYDIGGTFRFATDHADLVVTHVPRSKTRDFAALVRNRIGDRPFGSQPSA